MTKRRMVSFLYKLFNYDKIDKMQGTINVYGERIDSLVEELREYKGYKLKYEVTKMYVDDDKALLELFEIAKEAERQRASDQHGLYNQAQAQMQAQLGGCGQLGQGLLGNFGGRFL